MTPDILKTILARKREEAALLPSPGQYNRRDYALNDRRDFEAALRKDGISVIAEIKRCSPSKGALAPDGDPAALASAYQSGGAAAISCLTDRTFFGARPDDFDAVRRTTDVPMLRKDFIIDERQIHESAAMGADAILLIVRVLAAETLERFILVANALEISTLVEVHDASDITRAIHAGATIIGVNNRDLATFDVDLDNALRLRSHIPEHCLTVAESGIHTAEDVRRMQQAGYNAVLVGESLIRSDDPAEALRSLLDPNARTAVSGAAQ